MMIPFYWGIWTYEALDGDLGFVYGKFHGCPSSFLFHQGASYCDYGLLCACFWEFATLPRSASQVCCLNQWRLAGRRKLIVVGVWSPMDRMAWEFPESEVSLRAGLSAWLGQVILGSYFVRFEGRQVAVTWPFAVVIMVIRCHRSLNLDPSLYIQ